MTRPRVLFVGHTSIWDTPLFGAQLRSANLAQQLARNFAVTYACTSESETAGERPDLAERSGFSQVLIAGLPESIGSARWGGISESVRLLTSFPVPLDIEERISEHLYSTIRIANEREPFDAVWAHRSWNAEAARRAGTSRVICDIDDFEHVIFQQQIAQLGPYRRRLLHQAAIRNLARYERSLINRFPRVAITKPEDAVLLSADRASEPLLIPNGISTPHQVSDRQDSRPTFLFVGILGYGPNIDAATWFASDIFPLIRRSLPQARFVVAGRSPCPPELTTLLREPNIQIVESPEDLSTIYAAATAVVTPIRLGHGTRIKVLEALAHGRALISTTEATRGHGLKHEHNVLLADDSEAFAQHCIRVVNDAGLRLRLADAGLDYVRKYSTWDRVGERAISAVEGILAGG